MKAAIIRYFFPEAVAGSDTRIECLAHDSFVTRSIGTFVMACGPNADPNADRT